MEKEEYDERIDQITEVLQDAVQLVQTIQDIWTRTEYRPDDRTLTWIPLVEELKGLLNSYD